MRTKIFNYNHLKEEAINHHVTRVKAIMLNKANEILIAEAYHTPQLVGGHIKPHESLNTALKREILEETGITLTQDYSPFFCLKHYLKHYPKKDMHTSLDIYYFYIPANEKYHLRKLKLDKREQNGNFSLTYIPLKDLKKYLKSKEKLNPINKIINKEILLALKAFKKEVKL